MKKILLLICLVTIINANSYSEDYFIITKSLNIRNGAGPNYPILFELNAGDEIEVIDKSNKDWYQVKSNTQTGYAASQYLRFSRTTKPSSYSRTTVTWISNNKVVAVTGIIVLIFIVIAIRLETKEIPSQHAFPGIATERQGPGTNNQKVIIIMPTKHPGLAILLAIIFPYFGVLYATVSGFCWLFFSYIGMWALVFFWGLATRNDGVLLIGLVLSMIHFIISIIWAGVAANSYNKKIIRT